MITNIINSTDLLQHFIIGFLYITGIVFFNFVKLLSCVLNIMSKNRVASNKNKKVWESNLVRFEKAKTSRKCTTVVKSISEMNKMPTEQPIIDRFKSLSSNVKSRKERIAIVAEETKLLWRKLNIPIQQGKSAAERKIENVLKKLDKDSRKPGTQNFTRLFDITDEKGEWLCQEDKEFYYL